MVRLSDPYMYDPTCMQILRVMAEAFLAQPAHSLHHSDAPLKSTAGAEPLLEGGRCACLGSYVLYVYMSDVTCTLSPLCAEDAAQCVSLASVSITVWRDHRRRADYIAI